jgi:hypothetical protein
VSQLPSRSLIRLLDSQSSSRSASHLEARLLHLLQHRPGNRPHRGVAAGILRNSWPDERRARVDERREHEDEGAVTVFAQQRQRCPVIVAEPVVEGEEGGRFDAAALGDRGQRLQVTAAQANLAQLGELALEELSADGQPARPLRRHRVIAEEDRPSGAVSQSPAGHGRSLWACCGYSVRGRLPSNPASQRIAIMQMPDRRQLRRAIPRPIQRRLYDWSPSRRRRWRETPGLTGIPPSAGVALTFDDGPDPVYTPRLLDILDRREGRGRARNCARDR